MVDVGQDQRVDAASVGFDAAAERRGRAWYNISLLVFLIGPALVAIAIMGWLKAP